jgi:hypothetical protein
MREKNHGSLYSQTCKYLDIGIHGLQHPCRSHFPGHRLEPISFSVIPLHLAVLIFGHGLEFVTSHDHENIARIHCANIRIRRAAAFLLAFLGVKRYITCTPWDWLTTTSILQISCLGGRRAEAHRFWLLPACWSASHVLRDCWRQGDFHMAETVHDECGLEVLEPWLEKLITEKEV